MKLYHIEAQKLKNSTVYYLVKSVRMGGTVSKVRIKLGYSKPDVSTAYKLTTTPNLDIEVKALEKQLGTTRHPASYLTPEIQRRLDETRFWIPLFKLFLSPSEYEAVETLHETEYIAGTTAIEGNTLTVSQVDELINKGNTPPGKPLKELNEVQNAQKAAKYRESYGGRVSTLFIKKLHALILEDISDQEGIFRRIDGIGIVGEDFAVTPAILIESELTAAIDEYYTGVKAGRHPFEEAVVFHHRFELIHPFIDGNGRVGRELLRYMLAKAGYPDILIGRGDRDSYLEALREGNRGQIGKMVEAFAKLLFKDKRRRLFNEILNTRRKM